MTKTMNARTSASAKPGDTEVAGLHRSRRLRRPTRSLGSATPKILPSTLPPAAADRAVCQMMKEDSRPRDEAQCLAVFRPVADPSTYRTRKSVRTTRATPECRAPHWRAKHLAQATVRCQCSQQGAGARCSRTSVTGSELSMVPSTSWTSPPQGEGACPLGIRYGQK